MGSVFGRDFLDQFEAAALALAGASHLEQSAQRMNGRTLASDDLPNIGRMQTKFVHREAIPLLRHHNDGIGAIRQTLDHEFKPGLHETFPAQPWGAGALFRARLMKLATVSVGRAPLLSQYSARSKASVTLSSRF